MKNNEEVPQITKGQGSNALGVVINYNDCNSCGDCVAYCEPGVLVAKNGKIEVVENRKCTRCKACVDACMNAAIKV